jgi:DNA-binding NarL/FixJ family response regulator
MTRPTVLLADDHLVVAQGLASLLAQDFDVVGIARDGAALVAESRRLRPDLVVSDLSMAGGVDGLEALRRVKAHNAATKFVILTMHADAHLAGEALRAGASGYVLKQCAGEELADGLKDVMAGETYLSPRIAGAVAAALASPEKRGVQVLTVRQREVLKLLVDGRSMKEIAAALTLSPRTVETHKYQMMQTLGLETTAELIRWAVQHGIGAG